jgi:hypothetical protein
MLLHQCRIFGQTQCFRGICRACLDLDQREQEVRTPQAELSDAGDGLNKALVEPETVEAVLDRAKAVGSVVSAAPAPEPIVVEKPVVADPEELGTPPAKSKTVWTWLLMAIGAPIAAFGNLDWRVQLAIVVVIVGFAICGIKRRADLFKAVKDLKAELG